MSGPLLAATRWHGSPILTAISCRSPSSFRSTNRLTHVTAERVHSAWFKSRLRQPVRLRGWRVEVSAASQQSVV